MTGNLTGVEVGRLRVAYRRAGQGPPLRWCCCMEGLGTAGVAPAAGLIQALKLGRPHVGGLSWGGGLALELYRRHPQVPRSLVLASAYAGWAGSLPPEVVAERVERALSEAELPPEQWVRGYLPGLFTDSASAELGEEALAMMLDVRRPGCGRCAGLRRGRPA